MGELAVGSVIRFRHGSVVIGPIMFRLSIKPRCRSMWFVGKRSDRMTLFRCHLGRVHFAIDRMSRDTRDAFGVPRFRCRWRVTNYTIVGRNAMGWSVVDG